MTDPNKPRRPNPWGAPQNDDQRPSNPFGGGRSGGGGGGQEPPDLDAFLRSIQQLLSSAFPGAFGTARMIGISVAAVVLLWLSSGFYLVQPNQNAVVLTFGEYTRTDEMPGLKYRFPWPIQTAEVLNVTQERRIEVGYRDGSARGSRDQAQDVPKESMMLTGDENIIDIDFIVLWRIGNAKEYLYSVRNPDETIKLVAESAMREIIGRTKIQPALTEARGKIQSDARALMQQMLDDYKSGVTINNIQLLKVDPPDAVVDAFNDVQRARSDRERLKNEAEAYRNDIIPRARGESERLRQQAEGYKQEVINRATGDAERFRSIYAAYTQARDVTQQRMYLETMEEILKGANILLMDGNASSAGVLPYLPVEKLKRANSAPALNDTQPSAGASTQP